MTIILYDNHAMNEIINFIATERKAQGISLRQLGTMSGVYYPSLSLLERGKREAVELSTIEKVLDALGYRLTITHK